MNRAGVTQTINAMETAYQNILEHVPPGTPGKLDAVMKLRQRADDLFIEYATTRINHERTNYPAT